MCIIVTEKVIKNKNGKQKMILRSKKYIYKKVLLILILLGVSIGVGLGIVKRAQDQAIAATEEGATVTIEQTDRIVYEEWKTFRYFVYTPDGTKYTGFCANPSKGNPLSNYKAKKLPSDAVNNKIKLMAYIATVDNAITRAVMDDLLPNLSADLRYAYSHAVIGALHADDYTGLTASGVTKINNIIRQNNTDALMV
jgi:hypothetical protein